MATDDSMPINYMGDECACQNPMPIATYSSCRPHQRARCIGRARGGHVNFGTRVVKCTTCRKEIEGYNECQKCGVVDRWDTFEPCFDNRTFFKDNVIQFKEDIECVCHKCIETIPYEIIPKYLYCDLCKSAHERIIFSDVQGIGMNGIVKEVADYMMCLLPNTSYKYHIACGFGSNYDHLDSTDPYVLFYGELPDEIKIGMNICDECIAKFIDTGICYKYIKHYEEYS